MTHREAASLISKSYTIDSKWLFPRSDIILVSLKRDESSSDLKHAVSNLLSSLSYQRGVCITKSGFFTESVMGTTKWSSHVETSFDECCQS